MASTSLSHLKFEFDKVIMQRAITYFILIIITVYSMVSCNDGLSLQRYFVDHQESKNFITQDLPISMLNIDDSKLTAEQKEAYKSVKRLNFLGYKANETNAEIFNSELAKVKTILKSEKYNDLIDFTYQGAKVSMKYIGNDEEADEIVLFGSSSDVGFAIVRVLGDDMSPDKLMTLGSVFKNSDIDGAQFEDMMNFFK